jgi:hypothetical protein
MNRMLGLLWIPLAVIVTGAGGFGLCSALGWDPGLTGMTIAGAGSILAGFAGMVPTLLAGRGSQAEVAQAALIGTLAHLFVHALLAAVVFLAKPPIGPAFVYWLLAFYWVSLIVLAMLLAGVVRRSRADIRGN